MADTLYRLSKIDAELRHIASLEAAAEAAQPRKRVLERQREYLQSCKDEEVQEARGAFCDREALAGHVIALEMQKRALSFDVELMNAATQLQIAAARLLAQPKLLGDGEKDKSNGR
jgi:hypothetical protein